MKCKHTKLRFFVVFIEFFLNIVRFNLRYYMGCCPDTRWDLKEEQCVG